MHPDGATEAIVDFALAAGIPFAVVPCCVYSRDFPRRVDESGRPIRNLERFIAYLKAKAPPGRIATQILPFEGKNVVVFSRRASDTDHPLACETETSHGRLECEPCAD